MSLFFGWACHIFWWQVHFGGDRFGGFFWEGGSGFCYHRGGFFEGEGDPQLFLLPTKVPYVGFEFTQTGLIWDCHKGHMVLQGAYGLEEVIHCSAPEPPQLLCPRGEVKCSLRETAHYLGRQYQISLFEPGCSVPIVIYLLELFSTKKQLRN